MLFKTSSPLMSIFPIRHLMQCLTKLKTGLPVRKGMRAYAASVKPEFPVHPYRYSPFEGYVLGICPKNKGSMGYTKG